MGQWKHFIIKYGKKIELTEEEIIGAIESYLEDISYTDPREMVWAYLIYRDGKPITISFKQKQRIYYKFKEQYYDWQIDQWKKEREEEAG